MNIKILEGNYSAKGLKVALVVSRFNHFITSKLEEGAIDVFLRHEGDESNLTIVRTPGAFEIPLTCQKVAETGQFDGILALGAVIRGATPHFDYVSNEVTKGISQVSLKEKIPVSFGVLTTDNIEQAIERAGTKSGNKGSESMNSLIETINLLKNLK
ncbi:MAG: 6,7-dimethyl-8-ribityllumazine synthase [Deltaproteobacteria bacterium]|nr:6,7-dimethyl-8-ribityllumazine synthase [Deltaproteobacteria bacterium]